MGKLLRFEECEIEDRFNEDDPQYYGIVEDPCLFLTSTVVAIITLDCLDGTICTRFDCVGDWHTLMFLREIVAFGNKLKRDWCKEKEPDKCHQK